jgi:hypothetical protein
MFGNAKKGLAPFAVVLVAGSIIGMGAVPTFADAAGSKLSVSVKASSASVVANGGKVTLRVTIHGGSKCIFSARPKVAKFAGTVNCSNGVITRSGTLAKDSGKARTIYLKVIALSGNKAVSAQAWVKPAGKTTTVPPTTVTTLPLTTTTTTTTTLPLTTTTTTTLPPACTVPTCGYTFTVADLFDATGVAIGGVIQNYPCPDPGVCAATAGQQIDAVAIGMGAGPGGMSDPGLEVFNFVLVLAGGTQATVDSITFDSSVPNAMGGLRPVGPSSFGATIYF